MPPADSSLRPVDAPTVHERADSGPMAFPPRPCQIPSACDFEQKKSHPRHEGGRLTISSAAVILEIERALPVDGWPPKLFTQKSNRLGWSLGRLLLFIGRNKEADNADDDK